MLVDISRVFLSSAFVQAVGAVRSFALPALMIPEQLGFWNLFNVIVGYGANSHAGLLHGMNKLIPRLTTDSELMERDRIKDSVLWVTAVLAVLFSIVAGSYANLHLHYSLVASIILGAVITGQSVYIYYLCLLRSDCNFLLFSSASAIYSMLLTALVLISVFLFDDKVMGAIYGLLTTQLAICFLLVKSARYRFRLAIKWQAIVNSFRTGLPIILIGILDMMLLTFDRWIIAWKFSEHDLGIYAFATIFSVVIGSIPVAVGQVIYPILLKRSAESNSSDSENIAMGAVPVVVLCVALIGLMLYLFIPYVIYYYFEKYSETIKIAQVLIPASFFLSLTHLAGTYLIAVDQQNKLPPLQLLAFATGVCFSLFLLSIDFALASVAYGVSITYIFYGVGYLFLAKRHSRSSRFLACVFCFKIAFPYSLVIGLSSVLVSYVQNSPYQLIALHLVMSATLILIYAALFNDNLFIRYALRYSASWFCVR